MDDEYQPCLEALGCFVVSKQLATQQPVATSREMDDGEVSGHNTRLSSCSLSSQTPNRWVGE